MKTNNLRDLINFPWCHWLIPTALFLGLCGPAYAADQAVWRERPASIAHYQDLPTVDVPKQVSAAQPFEIRVTTFAGDCIRAGRHTIEVGDGVVDVRVYQEDEERAEDAPCNLVLFTPVMDLQIPGLKAGTWEVRVVGRQETMDGDIPLTISRIVVAE